MATEAGDALAELLGLNKSPREILGDAVGVADELAVAPVFACLRARFGLGDAAGDSAATGEVAVSAGDAVASDFLCSRCFFAGDSAGVGD